jgi:hypothetical protein
MSILTSIFDAAKAIVGKLGQNLGVTTLAGVFTRAIPQIVGYVAQFSGTLEERKAAVAELWDKFDAASGLTGPDVIHDLPAEAEENIFDGIKLIGETLSLYAVGAYSPTGERPDPALVRAAVGKLFDSSLAALGSPAPAGETLTEPGLIPALEAAGFPVDDAAEIAELLSLIEDHSKNPGSFLNGDRLIALERLAVVLAAYLKKVGVAADRLQKSLQSGPATSW